MPTQHIAKAGRFNIPINLNLIQETVKKAERTIQNFSKHFSDNPNLTPNNISPEKAESFPYKITTIQDNPLTVHLFTYNLTEFFRQIVSNNPNVTPQMANKITQTADTTLIVYLNFCSTENAFAVASVTQQNTLHNRTAWIRFNVKKNQPVSRYSYGTLFINMHHELQHIVESAFYRANNQWFPKIQPATSTTTQDIQYILNYLSQPTEMRAYASEYAIKCAVTHISQIKQQITRSPQIVPIMQLIQHVTNPNAQQLKSVATFIHQHLNRLTSHYLKTNDPIPEEMQLKQKLKEIIAQIVAVGVSDYQHILKQYEPKLLQFVKIKMDNTIPLPKSLVELTQLMRNVHMLSTWGEPEQVKQIITTSILNRFPNHQTEVTKILNNMTNTPFI